MKKDLNFKKHWTGNIFISYSHFG